MRAKQASVIASAEKAMTMNTAFGIKRSVGWYQTEYGTLPPSELTVLISVLQGRDIDGANPRKIAFWEPQPEKRRLWWRVRWGTVNEKGELIDGWGTPFRWRVENDAWTLTSAGKNLSFEEGSGDDIEMTIYKRSNQAVQ